MNIHDLARHLNISIGTVSRALNGRSNVSEKTRQRVLEAAKSLGYSPNQSGRSLRSGSTGMVGFMIIANRERAQMLIESCNRAALQQFLHGCSAILHQQNKRNILRWMIDVDPQEI